MSEMCPHCRMCGRCHWGVLCPELLNRVTDAEWADAFGQRRIRRAASGMEARRAAAENTDAVHDSPVPKADAQRPPQ